MSLELPKHLFDNYPNLSRERVSYLLQDFESYLNASVMRVRSTAYMKDLFPPPEKRSFYPYGEVLFRWKQIYMRRARQMQIEFKPLEPKEANQSSYRIRTKMHADRDQFEQIAYNLTNNAFKYALDGTVVEFDCKRDPDNWQRYYFQVSNYSHSIPPDEIARLGQHGYRASNCKRGTDGTGLGIWYCKQLAINHGGNLEIKPDYISPYSFRSLLLYCHFDENEREVMFKQAQEEYEIALDDHNDDPENNNRPVEVPFSSAIEMGRELKDELEKLKIKKDLWTKKAEQFDPYCKSREEDWEYSSLDKKNKDAYTNQSMGYAFTPIIAGRELMKGTMRFVVNVWFPH